MAHVDPPWVEADADRLDHLVFARIDDANDGEVAVGGIEISSIVGQRGNVDSLDFAEILRRVELGNARHRGDLNLLEQFVTADVDDAHPVGAVIADIGLRSIRQEGDIQRLRETRESS